MTIHLEFDVDEKQGKVETSSQPYSLTEQREMGWLPGIVQLCY